MRAKISTENPRRRATPPSVSLLNCQRKSPKAPHFSQKRKSAPRPIPQTHHHEATTTYRTAYLPLLALERAQPEVFDAREDAIRPGDTVRRMGTSLIGKVTEIRQSFALVDFQVDGKICSGVYFPRDLEIQPSPTAETMEGSARKREGEGKGKGREGDAFLQFPTPDRSEYGRNMSEVNWKKQRF